MTATWILAFTLLTVVVSLETFLLLAVMRQVGVLSLRIKPLPALVDDQAGPTPGTVLSEVELAPALNVDGAFPFERERSLIFFISPTCTLCGSLLKPLAAIARDHTGLEVFLVGEVEAERAADYARRAGTRLPMLVAPDLFREWGIEGTPFAIVADRARTILSSGVANTLEQLEVLVEAADIEPDEAALDERGSERAPVSTPNPYPVEEEGG